MIEKIVFTRNWSRFFDHFPRYHMKILLGDFNAKVGRENIFKPTIGNDSIHQIYRTIILPVVLYGCETWSLTLSEEHRLRVFENRVLRSICT